MKKKAGQPGILLRELRASVRNKILDGTTLLERPVAGHAEGLRTQTRRWTRTKVQI